MGEKQKYQKKYELIQLSALFALVFLILFLIQKAKHIEWIYASTAILFIGIFLSKLLIPLQKLWMGIGKFLNAIFVPILLGVLFLVFLTPLAILRRLISKPAIETSFQENKSYWVDLNNSSVEKNDLEHQF